jgi:hypothetical protein
MLELPVLGVTHECQDQGLERTGAPAYARGADQDLLGSFDPADPELERLWAEEARDRLDAYRRGELTARSLEEILEKYRKP